MEFAKGILPFELKIVALTINLYSSFFFFRIAKEVIYNSIFFELYLSKKEKKEKKEKKRDFDLNWKFLLHMWAKMALWRSGLDGLEDAIQ